MAVLTLGRTRSPGNLLLTTHFLSAVAAWSHERLQWPWPLTRHLQQSLGGFTEKPVFQLRTVPWVPKSCIRLLPAPPTHHQGIGEAQAHQASRKFPVQGVGDGGGSRNEYHARSDVLLRKDSSWPGLLRVGATGVSTCLTLGAESSSAGLSRSPTLERTADTQGLAEAEALELMLTPRLCTLLPEELCLTTGCRAPPCITWPTEGARSPATPFLTGSYSPGGPQTL